MYFQLNNTNSPPKKIGMNLFKESRRTSPLCDRQRLRLYVYPRRPEVMVGRDRGCTAKCAANEDETWLWLWQYYLSRVFLGSCWSNEYCVGFGDFLARARKKWIPISRWALHMTGCSPPRFGHSRPTCTAYASPLDIVQKDLSCLKAKLKADISSPEI